MKAKGIFRRILCISAALIVLTVCGAVAATIEVSQPTQVTSDSYYERGQAIRYGGGYYWLFYGRSASVTGNYGNDNPDLHDYVVYYKKATTIAGLAGASATQISGVAHNSNSYLGETGAAYFGGDVWAFATIDVGANADLYGWWTSDGGTTWNEVGPIISGLSDGQAHHDEVSFNGELWVVEGSGNFTTQHSATPKTGGWSAPLNVDAALTGGLVHFFVDGSDLYLAINASGMNYIYKYNSGTVAWDKVDENAPPNKYDPTLFKVGTDYVFAQAPWDGTKQYILEWSGSTLDGNFFNTTYNMVTEGAYGSNPWVDMWPIGFTDQLGTSYLFFTSERNPSDPTSEITGNIWYLELDWDLTNDHYTYIQEAINAATSKAGDVVNVAAGTYDEQVIIDKDLTLQGAGDLTLIQPSSTTVQNMDTCTYFGLGFAPVVHAEGPSSVTIQDLRIDGSLASTFPVGTARYVGLFLVGTGATVVSVTSVDFLNYPGSILGYNMYVYANSQTVSVEVDSCTISGVGRGGLQCIGYGLTMNIHDCTVTGPGVRHTGEWIANGILVWDLATGAITDNTVSDFAYDGATYVAQGIDASGAASVTGNTVTDCQYGIGAWGDGWDIPSATMSGNTVVATGLVGSEGEGVSGIAVDAWGGGSASVTISDNDLSGGGPGAGVMVGAEYNDPDSVDATISGNTITDWNVGLFLGDTGDEITVSENEVSSTNSGAVGIYVAATTTVDGIEVSGNDLSGNDTYAAENLAGGTLDASGNWWGDASGPSTAKMEFTPTEKRLSLANPSRDEVSETMNSRVVHRGVEAAKIREKTVMPSGAGSIAKGTGDAISGSVDYTPWLHDGTDTDLGTPGFQGDFSHLHVDGTSPQTGSAGHIEEGIDMVTGSTVEVEAGTYVENVVIAKSLDLLGADSSTTTIDGNNVGNAVTITASNVTLSGFTVTGGWANGLDVFHPVGGIVVDGNSGDTSLTAITIEDNIIDANPGNGIYVSAAGHGGGTSNVVIQNCRVSNNGGANAGISLTYPNYITRPVGVWDEWKRPKNILVQGNIVYGNSDYGVYVSAGQDNVIKFNVLRGNSKYGLQLASSWNRTDIPGEYTTVEDNDIYDNVRNGVKLTSYNQHNTFIRNRIYNNGFGGSSDYYKYGFLFQDGNDNVIEYNEITGNALGGLYLWGKGDPSYTWYSTTNNTITGNFISNHTAAGAQGLYIPVQYGNPNSGFLNSTIFGNSITNNMAYGLENADGTQIVDASGNWWGSSTPAGVASEVSTHVDYTPWLDDGTDQSGDPGFQADLSHLHVDDSSPQTGTMAPIEEGIDMVTGSTVEVAAGTYSVATQILIDKPLMLLGEDAATTVIDGPGSSVAIPCEGLIAADGVSGSVTIKNFTLQDAPERAATWEIYLVGIKNMPAGASVTLEDNILVGRNDSNAFDGGIWIAEGDATSQATIRNNDLSGTFRGMVLERMLGPSTVEGNDIHNLVAGVFAPDTYAAQGLYYLIYGSEVSTQQLAAGNTFRDYAGRDIMFQGGHAYIGDGKFTNVKVQDNTVNAIGSGPEDAHVGITLYNDPASDLNACGVHNAEVFGNTITAGGADSKGIVSHGHNTGIDIHNNQISGLGTGILVEGTGTPGISVNGNSIASNAVHGLNNTTAVLVNAEYNWWGSADGPEDLVGTDEAQIDECYDVSTMKNAVAELSGTLGNASSENVDYCPWLGGDAGFDTEIYVGCNDPCDDFCLDFKLTGTDIRFFHFEYPLPTCIDLVSSSASSVPGLQTFFATMSGSDLHIDGSFDDPNFTGANVKIGEICFTHDGTCPNTVQTLTCTYDEVIDGSQDTLDVSPGMAVINVDNTAPTKDHPAGDILPCYSASDDPDWSCWNLSFYKGAGDWQCDLLQATLRIYSAPGCDPGDLVFSYDFFTTTIPGDFNICYPTNQTERDDIWNAIYPGFGDGTYYVRLTVTDDCCNEADNCDAFTFCTDTYTDNYFTCLDARPAHNHICLEWDYTSDPVEAVKCKVLRSPYRAGNYPVYAAGNPVPTGHDDATWYVVYEGTDTYPCIGASWYNDDGQDCNGGGTFFDNATRDIYWYAGFTKDAAGNWSDPNMTLGTATDRATSYWLGDVTGILGGPADGSVFGAAGDAHRLSVVYGTSPAGDPEVDYGPETEDHGIGTGIPVPDDAINWRDLKPFSFNYNIVGPSGDCDTWPLILADSPPRSLKLKASEVAVWLERVPSSSPHKDLTMALMLTNPDDATHLFHTRISFNPDILALTEVRRGEVAITHGHDEFFAAPTTGEGVVDVDLAALGPEGYLVGSGAVAYLDFTCRTAGASSEIWLKEAILYDGEGNEIPLKSASVEVENLDKVIPSDFALYSNYPNPFNPTTTIKYDLPQACHVTLVVYNIRGQKVATLVDGMVDAGSHQTVWNANDLSSGVYFCRIAAGKFTKRHKMILMK
jgi:parallel beta-helix repeat protein